MSLIDFRDQNRKLALSASSKNWNNIPRSIFLADLEENPELPSWFKGSRWNAPAFRLPSAFARFAQNFLNHVVVGLWPVGAAFDAPEVDDPLLAHNIFNQVVIAN